MADRCVWRISENVVVVGEDEKASKKMVKKMWAWAVACWVDSENLITSISGDRMWRNEDPSANGENWQCLRVALRRIWNMFSPLRVCDQIDAVCAQYKTTSTT